MRRASIDRKALSSLKPHYVGIEFRFGLTAALSERATLGGY